MPTLYGEGRNVFYRLQEEILRTSPDTSLFAWGFWTEFKDLEELEKAVATDPDSVRQSLANREASYLFAPSPSNFDLLSAFHSAGSDGSAGTTSSFVSSIRRIRHYRTTHTRLCFRVLNVQWRDLLSNPWYPHFQRLHMAYAHAFPCTR